MANYTFKSPAENMETMTQNMPFAPCVGYLAGKNEKGEVLVAFDNNGPRPAKLVAGLCKFELMKEANKGREVLLIFDKGNIDYPVIVNLMADSLEGLISFEITEDNHEKPKDALIDGKRITIEAKDEIVLKCGAGSIVLRRDGKIVLKGVQIVSRAKQLNKIKGAAIKIN